MVCMLELSSKIYDLNDWRDIVMERSCSLTSLIVSRQSYLLFLMGESA
jgi:hypothetical protein